MIYNSLNTIVIFLTVLFLNSPAISSDLEQDYNKLVEFIDTLENPEFDTPENLIF